VGKFVVFENYCSSCTLENCQSRSGVGITGSGCSLCNGRFVDSFGIFVRDKSYINLCEDCVQRFSWIKKFNDLFEC
jgi:hypothetical protein